MSKKPIPMRTVHVDHAAISIYEYRSLVEEVQNFCIENRKLRKELNDRIGQIDILEKDLAAGREELERYEAKNNEAVTGTEASPIH